MKILITGGAGFIGSHIAQALVDRGDTVVIIDNLTSGKRENLPRGARFYRADYGSSLALHRIFRKEKPEAVFHLAARINVRESQRQPLLYTQTNILGSMRLIAIAKRYGVKKFLYASTGGVMYGETDVLPIAETTVPAPSSPYAMGKLFVEHYLLASGMHPVIFRYSNVYGPRQNPWGETGVIAVFSQKMLANEQPIIYNAGEMTRDYIFVSDVVAANIRALDNDHISGVYNIGTGRETSVNQIFTLLRRQFDVTPDPRYAEMSVGGIEKSALSSEKFRKISGWQPEISLEKGIAETVLWFKRAEKDAPQKIRMRLPRFLYRLASFV